MQTGGCVIPEGSPSGDPGSGKRLARGPGGFFTGNATERTARGMVSRGRRSPGRRREGGTKRNRRGERPRARRRYGDTIKRTLYMAHYMA